jgi:hypothetical protein
MPKKKLTALTDPENIMVVWQDTPAAKRPAKKAAPKKAKRTS